jgi:pimeloyl-ACP methyl ester carboxylesterase
VEHYRRLTSNSEIEIFENSAHMTMLDEPDAYVAAVRNFLTRVDEGY